MKKVLVFTLAAITFIGCSVKASLEATIIKEMCYDSVADSSIVMLTQDSTSTHYVKGAFGEKGLYLLSDLPLSKPKMRIDINDGLRTLYISEFEYVGQHDTIYIYSLHYDKMPKLSRYEYDLMQSCTLYYYNGTLTIFDWQYSYYPKEKAYLHEWEFEKWFCKAIPYILN